MTRRSLATIAEGLEGLGVVTPPYQFPNMEKGGKRTHNPPVAHATVRAVVAEAKRQAADAPSPADGRSIGGRMTSQAQANEQLPGIVGLVFLAFPLHPGGELSVIRAEHLAAVTIPILFLQGSNDALAEVDLLLQAVDGLGDRATLDLIPDAGYAFHVPARTGRKDPEVLAASLAVESQWMAAVAAAPRPTPKASSA